VKSGFVPKSVDTAEKAIAIMLKGRELGLPPIVALSNIDVIEGRPVCEVPLLLAICRSRIPGLKVEVDSNDDSAMAIVQRPGNKPYMSKFSLADAKRAGLVGKTNWVRYPRLMLEYRAIGHALKVACGDAIMGLDGPSEFEPRVYEAAESATVVAELPEPFLIQEWQTKLIHKEANRVFGGNEEKYRHFLEIFTEKRSSTELTAEEAGVVLRAFSQMPDFTPEPTQTPDGQPVDYQEGREEADTDESHEQEADEARVELDERTTRQTLSPLCADCGAEITDHRDAKTGRVSSAYQIAEKSREKFGRCLCFACGVKAKGERAS